MLKVRAALAMMEFSDGHPRLVRFLLRPIANLPWLRGKLKVMIRAYMGATAFDIHDVDVEKGRIGIGGVDEIMFGSELVWVLHEVLGRHGEEEKRRALYDIGFLTGYFEAMDAIRKGRWSPRVFVPLMTSGDLIDAVRRDPLMARFLDKVLEMESRIIISEGGWGRIVEFDYGSTPIRAVLANSQEAEWLGPSPGPVCHYLAGGAAGHVSAITGERYTGVEVECSASGAARCVFEFAPAARSKEESERSALADRLLALDRDGCAGRQ